MAGWPDDSRTTEQQIYRTTERQNTKLQKDRMTERQIDRTTERINGGMSVCHHHHKIGRFYFTIPTYGLVSSYVHDVRLHIYGTRTTTTIHRTTTLNWRLYITTDFSTISSNKIGIEFTFVNNKTQIICGVCSYLHDFLAVTVLENLVGKSDRNSGNSGGIPDSGRFF